MVFSQQRKKSVVADIVIYSNLKWNEFIIVLVKKMRSKIFYASKISNDELQSYAIGLVNNDKRDNVKYFIGLNLRKCYSTSFHNAATASSSFYVYIRNVMRVYIWNKVIIIDFLLTFISDLICYSRFLFACLFVRTPFI